MILVTGGAGYIGTHTLIELDHAGYEFVVYDNLSNSSKEALNRVKNIIGKDVTFIEGDIRNKPKLSEVFNTFQIESVIHFAGLKVASESIEKPLEYYDNNISGTIELLKVMGHYGCKNIVASSSAAIYGDHHTNPIQENFLPRPTSPYGRSKLTVEEILIDLHRSDNSWRPIILRYFNPAGAHESGLIGEDPNGTPNNLMPYISQVAAEKFPQLQVFGNDYDTADGTGVRDYLHVVDLAIAHVKALEFMGSHEKSSDYPLVANLGTGRGYSVLELIQAFQKISGKEISYETIERRTGDIASCYADPSFAKKKFKWEATRGIDEMCVDSWRWQSNNPNGYDTGDVQ